MAILSVIASEQRERGNPAMQHGRRKGWIASSRSALLEMTQRRRVMKEIKQPAVYMMASGKNGTLYTGVTSNLVQRSYQHKTSVVKGFTSKYGCNFLVWYELHETMESAITREKQIKGGSRKRKLTLIEAINPEWKDLYETIL